jgi:hypothetical protein
MRKSWLFIVALVTIGFLSGAAWAGKVSIKGTHTANEIRATCAREDGVFGEQGDTYSCSKECGNSICGVTCTGGKCTGECPSCGRRERRVPVLGGADAVDQTLMNSVQRPSKSSSQR